VKMLNIVTSGIVAVSAAGLALSLGAGAAGAIPDVVDRPYKDAKAMIAQSGAAPVVATRTGHGADDDKCLVTNAWDAPYLRPGIRGRMFSNNDVEPQVFVALNCNGELAAAGTPGNSAASPVGRQAKSEAEEEAAKQEEQELAQAATPNE
jgi:hypothetical protein